MASVRPLYTSDDKLVSEPRLEGEWVSKTLENASAGETGNHWRVTADKPGCYTVDTQDNEQSKEKAREASYQGCLLNLGNKTFFDSTLRTMKVAGKDVAPQDMGDGMISVHLIGRVWAQQDFIRMADLNAKWLESNSPEAQHTNGVFTGPTQELKNLLGPGPDEAAVGAIWYLCRPGADCDARVVADALARDPDDLHVIEGAGFFFLRHGDYDRSVALFRHCVEKCQPGSDSGFTIDPHVYLGYALLFKRDFAGARKEFMLAHKQDSKDPIEGFLAITYFLEGNYAEAHRLSGVARQAGAQDSPQEIILDYASLVRMGKAKQAEALLAERSAKFIGNDDEHLLLLRATGRIKDFTPQWKDSDVNEGDTVFYAIARAAQGDTAAARQALEATLQRGDKALPGFLGATIEMERLNARPPVNKSKQ